MKLFIENCNGTLRLCLNVIRWVGFLVPDHMTGFAKNLSPYYAFFWYMFIVGIYVITQTGDLIQVWGNVSDMTNVSFLLFTNLAFTTKIFNVMLRKKAIQAIIDEGDYELRTEKRDDGVKIVKSSNRETTNLLYLYALFTIVTVFGWAASAEKNQLPLRAWYPYDTSKSPAYELTYIHQIIAVVLQALVHVSLDLLVTSLTAVVRCRLKLVNLSLRTLCNEIEVTDKLLSKEDQEIISERLRRCVLQHQSALKAAAEIQRCFTEPILAQFTVSMVIICATAYQLAVETNNSTIRLISMSSYLMGMTMQVFLYCYQGNHLSEESSNIADAAYQCSWYACSLSLRRSLLIVMVRSKRIVYLTAGGFTTLSLACFISIIKASYSFLTVLQQMEMEK